MNLYNVTIFFKLNGHGTGYDDFRVLAENVSEAIEKVKLFFKEDEYFDQITEIKLLYSNIIM
jgi:hypothetical protein